MARRDDVRSWARRASALVLAAGLAACLGAGPALGDVNAPAARVTSARIARNTCSGRSHWRLAVRVESPGVLWVRVSLKGGRPGQRWNIYMDDNGTGFFAGSRISGEHGSVVIIRRTADRAGLDRVRMAARNIATSETCRGRVVV